MGEAKRRGSYEARVMESKTKYAEGETVTVAAVLADLGLPADSKFLGYVIHNPDADDYLCSLEDTPAMTKRLYCPTPEQALIFDDYFKASAESAKISKPTIVGLLFDTGDQYAVGFNE